MPEPKPLSEVQELAQELEKYRQIVETAGDAVVTINELHEVVYMNAAAEMLFGYQRSEMLGCDGAQLLPEEARQRYRELVSRFLTRPPSPWLGRSSEFAVRRRDGEVLPIAATFSRADTSTGLLLTAIMRDLSVERRLAERLKLNEQLALVGQMVATVNHEIRTPLMLMGGFARQLLKEAGLSDRARHKLSIIAQEAGRLEGLLGELNDISRPTQSTLAPLDLGPVLEHVREIMAPLLAKLGLRLRLQVPERALRVAGDRDRLGQVLINLIQNAAQASLAGQEVFLGLREGPGPGRAELMVRDQGSGISPEDLVRVFTPFFTTKKGGTGLGLPLARRIAEEHGGHLELESAPGQGTTARLVLPSLPARA